MMPPSIFVNAALTTRSGSAPAIASAVHGPVRLDPGTGANPVEFFKIQQEVGYKGIQSDPEAITVAYRLDSGASDDTLHAQKIQFQTTGTPNLTAGTATPVVFDDGELDEAKIIIAEGQGAAHSPGDAVVYFIRNEATSPAESFRALMLRPGGSALEIGSLTGTVGTYSPREAAMIAVKTLPSNGDITANPGWAGRFQHVFITEFRFLDSAGSKALRHRVFDMSLNAADGACFAPAVDGTTAPCEIDTGQDADATDLRLVTDAETLGAFFIQGGHLWYNEFYGGSWYPRTGEFPGPQLVDNLEPASVAALFLFEGSCSSPETLPGCSIFYTKIIDPGGSERLFARIRNP
jgi:hypothetical protein